MREVIALFMESGTVDELGIGSSRAAPADGMFPGASVHQAALRPLHPVAAAARSEQGEPDGDDCGIP